MENKVKFMYIGRENFCGEFSFSGTQEEIDKQILDECGKHLLSSCISIEDNKVFAGFRCVGQIEIK